MRPGNILKKLVLFLTGSLVIFMLVVNSIIGTKAGTAESLTVSKIKQVKPGMSLEQLVSILGKPISMQALHGLHNIGCANPRPTLNEHILPETDLKLVIENFFQDKNYCCEGNKEDFALHNETTFTYTRPVKLAKSYPMLWVQVDSTLKVSSVYIKMYAGTFGFDSFDDVSIYGLSADSEINSAATKSELKISPVQEEKLNDAFN